MLYVALGDSITYGYSSTSEETRYATLVQRSLSKQPVNLHVHAKPGWSSKYLLKSLKTIPPVIWGEAKLITIMIGGNDVLRSLPGLLDGNPNRMLRVAERYYENLVEIVQMIRRPQSTMVIATIYNPFPNSMIVEQYIEVLNKTIRMCAQREGLLLADVHKHFTRRESDYIDGYRRGRIRDFRFFGNPIHPNDEGHRHIARIIMEAYRKPLTALQPVRRKSRG